MCVVQEAIPHLALSSSRKNLAPGCQGRICQSAWKMRTLQRRSPRNKTPIKKQHGLPASAQLKGTCVRGRLYAYASNNRVRTLCVVQSVCRLWCLSARCMRVNREDSIQEQKMHSQPCSFPSRWDSNTRWAGLKPCSYLGGQQITCMQTHITHRGVGSDRQHALTY